MGAYLNCGAQDAVSRDRVPTKKALRELIAENPSSVFFDCTEIPPRIEGYRGDELTDRTPILVVVGPDPHTSRVWYANVQVRNGKVVVS